MAKALADLEARVQVQERKAEEARARASASTWWTTPTNQYTQTWVASGGATGIRSMPLDTPFLTPMSPTLSDSKPAPGPAGTLLWTCWTQW